MYSIDTKSINFDIISFQAKDIVSQYRLEKLILVDRFFPFAVRNTELFRIILGSFRYDLVAAVRTAFSVFGMVTAIGRFYFDHLFHDLFHRLLMQTRILCQFGISQSIDFCCSDDEEKKKSIDSS